MKNFDLIKIRRALPHGSITEIAEKLGVGTRTISEVLNEGWHKELTNEVVSAALEILKRDNIDPDVIKEAEDLKFTTDSLYGVHSRRFGRKRKPAVVKSVFSKIFGGGVIPIVIALAVGAWIFGKSKKTA